ncbi:MAG: hypothetical protein AB1689_19480, partial [Thermodesulfobacteriota bacterium]
GDEGTPLTVEDARHLLRRTGFGAPEKEVAKLLARHPTRGAAADKLLSFKPAGFTPAGRDLRLRQNSWLRYMIGARNPLQEKLGTDHGSQGPVLVVGGAVAGGVYGNHPDIRPSSLDDSGNTVYSQAAGDPFRSTDLRDVYGTILTRWLGMSPASVLAGVLPVDTGDPDERWTEPDLDLAFL